jgi:hypothetical protein
MLPVGIGGKELSRRTFPLAFIPDTTAAFMFIDIGSGWHLNLAHVARVHVRDHGGSGTSIRFFAASGEALGECTPATPEQLSALLRAIEAYGRANLIGAAGEGG